MKVSLQGKRLLVLGSTASIADIVLKAQELGVYTVVTDYVEYEHAPAKQIADEYLNVSLSDVHALANYIKEHHIDGILTGFSDSYLHYYRSLCEETGLVCYGDKRTFEIATNKEVFKRACAVSGVQAIPGACFHSYDDFASEATGFDFPMIFKPADNSGSRGVVKCEDLSNAERAFEYALSFSPSHCVVCESFMDSPSIGVSYQLCDGHASLSSVCDRIHYRSLNSGSTVVSALVYPSKYLDRYREEVHPSILDMLAKHGFENGMLSLQAFVEEKSFYQCEMCFRPSGGKHYVFIKDQSGVDELGLLVEYALTGRMESYQPEAENPQFAEKCLLIHVLGRENCVIARIGGLDELRNEEGVLRVVEHLRPGSRIGGDGTTLQTVVTVWRKIPAGKTWLEVARATLESIEITDEQGASLVIDAFSDEQLSKYSEL